MKKMGIVSIIIILVDQIIKHLVVSSISLNEHIQVIKNFFYIMHIENGGAAWSLLDGNRLFLILISILAIFLIYVKCIKNKHLNNLQILLYGLLFGGIIGNLIDRIVYGYVIDYLEFIFGNYHYPIFNLADICIVISILILIIDDVRGEICKRKK